MKLICSILVILSLSMALYVNSKTVNLKSETKEQSKAKTEEKAKSEAKTEIKSKKDDSLASYGVAANGGNYLPLNAVYF
jgi:hypothetical protein